MIVLAENQESSVELWLRQALEPHLIAETVTYEDGGFAVQMFDAAGHVVTFEAEIGITETIESVADRIARRARDYAN